MEELRDLANQLILRLTERGQTLSLAESCTGGLLSSAITDIPGASKIFVGGLVVYSTELKRKFLNVPDSVFKYGVISKEMAESMAISVRALTGSDFSIATTGNLGPTSMEEGKPTGLVYIAIASVSNIISKELHLKGDRLENKREATFEALRLLLDFIR